MRDYAKEAMIRDEAKANYMKEHGRAYASRWSKDLTHLYSSKHRQAAGINYELKHGHEFAGEWTLDLINQYRQSL